MKIERIINKFYQVVLALLERLNKHMHILTLPIFSKIHFQQPQSLKSTNIVLATCTKTNQHETSSGIDFVGPSTNQQ